MSVEESVTTLPLLRLKFSAMVMEARKSTGWNKIFL